MSHTCKSLVMHCMDFRLVSKMKEFMAEHSMVDDADLVSIAGAAKNIVDPESQAFALKQIEISKTLHGMKEVNLVNHLDCGAYGGRKAFESDEAEYAKLTGDLRGARDIIKAKWPDLAVKLWLAHIEETDHEKKIWVEEIQ
jgi:carbonic anhydrase